MITILVLVGLCCAAGMWYIIWVSKVDDEYEYFEGGDEIISSDPGDEVEHITKKRND